MEAADTAATSPPGPESGVAKKRKRPRAVQACDRCRTKKYKCDELYPACSHCTRAGASCRYNRHTQSGYASGVDASYVRALENKVDELAARLGSFGAAAAGSVAPAEVPAPPPVLRQPELPPGADAAVTTPATPVSGQLSRVAAPTAFTTHVPAEVSDSPHDSEITDINEYTNEVEFHGNTSSMAFLGDLERSSRPGWPPAQLSRRPSLVSAMHNRAFAHKLLQPPASSSPAPLEQTDFHATYAHVFIEAYFSGIHFVHPFVDKEAFLSRASDLWFGRSPQPSKSFIAMYFSLLALGALTRSWPEEKLGGYSRFEWSRKLFNEAMGHLQQLQFSNDLETVHCLYFMAKICQNELTPHLAWTFLGRVIRTCISAGFNRDTPHLKSRRSKELSRTWWGLFSLEVETSFSLGRPDTLGMDEYHNRPLPEKDRSEYAIIPCMVDFARIVRKVSLFYTAQPPRRVESTLHALQLESELDAWLAGLPPWIQPNSAGMSNSATALREPEWCRRQKLVLELRYHNTKLALFRAFIDLYANGLRTGGGMASDALFQCASKCVESAKRTIEVMHETFKVHVYFRTWWYNTTYIMTAAAALLSYIKRCRAGPIASLVKLVGMAIDILDAMDESVVARKCSEILRRHLKDAEDVCNSMVPSAPIEAVDYPGEMAPLGTTLESEEAPFFGYHLMDYSFQDMATFFEGLNDADLI